MRTAHTSPKVALAALALLCPALVLGQRLPRPTLPPGGSVAVEPTCTTAVAPVVYSVTMDAPDPGDVLHRGAIKYVSGEQLDIAVTIPACTYVSDVTYGGFSLATEPDPIEGRSTFYEVLSDRQVSVPDAGPHHEVKLRLHFGNLGRGASFPVEIITASKVGMLSSVYAFTLVQVADVKGTVDVAITEAELRNDFVTGIYQTFGDYNQQGSVNEDGVWVRETYGADYGDDLQFRVEDDGIHVSMEFKADIDDFCDPTVSLWGHFQLEKDPAGVYVVWQDGPHADFDFPIYCDAILYTVGLVVQAGIWYIMEPSAANKFGEMIEERIAGAFPTDDARWAIQSIGTIDGAVVATFNPTWASVTIDVPYDPAAIGNSPATHGVALPPGSRVALVGGGLIDACRYNGATEFPACDTHTSGVAGLFNWNQNPPVPSPWELINEQWVYFQPRALARGRLAGFTRDPSRLPASERNVGLLLARVGDADSNGTLRMAGSACALDVPDGDGEDQPFLLLGVNDHASNSNRSYGGGSYRVSIGLPGTVSEREMIAQVGLCPLAPSVRRTIETPQLPTESR